MAQILETERLILREYTEDDFDDLYEFLSDAETMQHYPHPFDETAVHYWISRNLDRYEIFGFGLWAVVNKETGKVIGDKGLLRKQQGRAKTGPLKILLFGLCIRI